MLKHRPLLNFTYKWLDNYPGSYKGSVLGRNARPSDPNTTIFYDALFYFFLSFFIRTLFFFNIAFMQF